MRKKKIQSLPLWHHEGQLVFLATFFHHRFLMSPTICQHLRWTGLFTSKGQLNLHFFRNGVLDGQVFIWFPQLSVNQGCGERGTKSNPVNSFFSLFGLSYCFCMAVTKFLLIIGINYPTSYNDLFSSCWFRGKGTENRQKADVASSSSEGSFGSLVELFSTGHQNL